jgi:hypothetical protein
MERIKIISTMGEYTIESRGADNELTDLVKERKIATADLLVATTAHDEALESLHLFLGEQKGVILPLKGQVAYTKIRAARGGWHIGYLPRLLEAEEYVVHEIHPNSNVVELSLPGLEGHRVYGVPLVELDCATQEEVSLTREQKEQGLSRATALSGLSSAVALKTTIMPQSEPF